MTLFTYKIFYLQKTKNSDQLESFCFMVLCPISVHHNAPRPERAERIPKGSMLVSPPRPTKGETMAPQTKKATPNTPLAAPDPTFWAMMAREKLVGLVMP